VRRTLLEGQMKVERARVETYWQTGKLIHEHILQYKERADYGRHVIQKLARELKVSGTLLYQTRQFYQAFPILHTCVKSSSRLNWSHFRQLVVVPDKDTRIELMSRAEEGGWSTLKLNEKIKLEQGAADDREKKVSASKPLKLLPKLGELYTFRLLEAERVNAGADSDALRVDLGFNNHYLLPAERAKGFREGQIVRSLKDKKGDYSLEKSGLKEDALFTFRADVERVVDGDTLIVVLDLGFRLTARHYLRLRGIDCAELDTAEGKKAKAFVEKAVKGAEYLLVTSTRSDKYGRYLADLFIPPKNSDSVLRTSSSVVRTSPSNIRMSPSVIRTPPSVIRIPPSVIRTPPSVIRTPPSVILNVVKDLVFLNQVLLDEGLAEYVK